MLFTHEVLVLVIVIVSNMKRKKNGDIKLTYCNSTILFYHVGFVINNYTLDMFTNM